MSQLPKAQGALCEECPLRRHPYVPSYIPEGASLLVIGEGPGAQEVAKGKPFVGQSGKLLELVLKQYGLDYEQVARTNVVACRPPNNREPRAKEIECCHGRLDLDLEKYDGNIIIPVGKTAGDVFTGEGLKISERRGHWFKMGDKKVMPTWHPAYVLRRPGAAREFYGDIKRALTQQPNHWLTVQPAVELVEDVDRLEALLRQVPYGETVAFDLETDQVVWYDTPDAEADRILMLGMAWEPNAGIIVRGDLLYNDSEVRKLLNRFFARADLELVGHNAKFDAIFLRTVGINVRPTFDTMLAHYALWEETGGHGLKNLALEYYGLEDYEQPLVQAYLNSRNDRYSKAPYENLAAYCCWDVCVTRQLRFDLEREMRFENVYEDPFLTLYMPLSWALTEVEWTGIPIDHAYVDKWQERLFDYADTLEDHMADLAGDPGLNPRSPMQVSNVLYNEMGLPKPRARGVNPTSTSKKALAHIKEGQSEFVDTLRKYRRVHKMNRSYLKNILKYADANGRVHPSALIHGTEVGRLSFRNPAIQTIPRPYEDVYGAVVRAAFVAPPGYKFIVADYSQAELRVAAILSGEPFLLDVYRDERDLHSEVAIAMYGKDFTPAQRVLTKMFNFSYLYGGSEYSFAEDAGLPIDVARKFVHDYNEIMPVLNKWRWEQLEKAKRLGFVVSPFGRKRRFPLITPHNLEDVRKAAVHAPVAGTSSDLTQMSLMKAVRQGHEVVLTVHDSIGEIAPVDEAEHFAEALKNIMVQTAAEHFPEVPWKVDVDVRDRWSPLPEEIYGDVIAQTFR